MAEVGHEILELKRRVAWPESQAQDEGNLTVQTGDGRRAEGCQEIRRVA